MTNNTSHMTDQCATIIAPGTTLPFASVNEPGAYVCNWSGHLLRIPENGAAPRQSRLVDTAEHEPAWVTKIADNPFIPITKARMLAAAFDVSVNF